MPLLETSRIDYSAQTPASPTSPALRPGWFEAIVDNPWDNINRIHAGYLPVPARRAEDREAGR